MSNVISNYDGILRVFPKEPGVDTRKLQVSKEGLYSVSRPRDAEAISKIIIRSMDEPANTLVVTDATANIGGNVISFSKHFKSVNAVEISLFHFSVLQNNVEVYKRENVSTYCDDYLLVAPELKQDIIFLDPPWGGVGYKSKKSLNLYLSGTPVEEIVNRISTMARMIVLKVPSNFDFKNFFNKVTTRTFTTYKIRNYMIIVIRTDRGKGNINRIIKKDNKHVKHP